MADSNSCVVAPYLVNISWPNGTSLSDLNIYLVTSRNIAPLCVLGCIILLGIVSNSVMLYILSTKYKKSNYRICSIWLAIMDVVGCVTTLPFFIHLFLNEIAYPSEILCKAGLTGAAVFLFTCHLMLVVIAVDRYLKVYHPFRRQLSGANLNFLFVLCILLACVFASPHAIFAGERTVSTGVFGIQARLCFVSNAYKMSFLPGKYYIAINVLSVVLTISVILMYSRIMAVMSRFRRFFQKNEGIPLDSDHPPLFSSTTRTVEVRRSIITLVSATISFIITTFPFTTLAMLALFLQHPVLCNVSFPTTIAFRVIACTVLLNTVANPFIYGFADNQFRQELKKMCGFHK